MSERRGCVVPFVVLPGARPAVDPVLTVCLFMIRFYLLKQHLKYLLK